MTLTKSWAGILSSNTCGKYCGWAIQDCLNDLFVFNTTTKRCVATLVFFMPKKLRFNHSQPDWRDGVIVDVETRWTNLTNLTGGVRPTARESMGLTAVGNFLYLFGGQGPEGQLRGLFWFYWKIIIMKHSGNHICSMLGIDKLWDDICAGTTFGLQSGQGFFNDLYQVRAFTQSES